jgi:hemerythrin-like domain-containing protein
MTTDSNLSSNSPIDSFSNCHDGIISHLNRFGEIISLVKAATSARKIAEDTVAFFRVAVFDHHSEEERDLFPAVLANAEPGEEQSIARTLVDGLTAEHREIESQWVRLEPKLVKLAKGHIVEIDEAAVQKLVDQYTAHARLEEREFLPLAEKILGRRDPKMAALGLALHTRHAFRAARRGLRGS